MKRFVIIDGNSIAYRAFYALPILTNKKGLFTNSIFGFINMFLKIIEDLKPTHLAVVFDFPAKTFRNNLFKDYKATRKPMPPELAEQMPVIKEVLKILGANVLEKEGFEADDIIGTLAKKFDLETVIVTGDKDCLQLIDKTTKVLLTKRGITETVLMDEKAFNEEYGFDPCGIVDLKAIMGDSSDNIPGVKGIGEKGARDLISKFKNLHEVYANVDGLKGKQKALLIEQEDMAKLSYKLATIDVAINLDVKEKDFVFNLNLDENAKNKMEELEFYAILKRKEFAKFIGQEKQTKNFKNIEIKTYEDLELLNELKSEVAIFFKENSIHFADCETLNFEIKLQQNLIDNGLDFKQVISILKNKFESKKIKKILFNFKDTKKQLNEFSVSLDGLLFDVHLAYWVVNSELNAEDVDKVFDFCNQKSICASTLYACKNYLHNKLIELDLLNLYNKIEMPLIDVLYSMEDNGIKISSEKLNEILTEYNKEEENLQSQIYAIAGSTFNINSPKQIANVLFNILGLPSGKKQSTAVNVLLELKNRNPIIPLILKHRTLSKIISTYLIAFKDFINDGFIHTTYNQTGTVTGRLSSSNPNLQNIPVKKEEGKLLRKMFISRFPNGKIVSADYNQIELRLVAHLTKDEKMINAFNAGRDIHQTTASEVFNIPLYEVTKEQRNRAKAINFGIVYGISAFGLSEQLSGVGPKEAGEYIKKYYESYPKIKEFMNSVILQAETNGGYATTMFGRKRKVEEVFSSNFQIKQFGERAIMNMPFQGSASDIIKIAMINVFNRIIKENLKSKLILQIHDELIVDACENEIQKIENILKEEMEGVVKLSVPLTVDIESGISWFDV